MTHLDQAHFNLHDGAPNHENERLVSHAPEETEQTGTRLAQQLCPGDVVLLQGELGAGKTHFVRGLCAGLGLKDLWQVDSPTFTIVNHYAIGPGVDHLDLYRLQGADDLENLNFDELFTSQSIKIIEWPERLADCAYSMRGFLVQLEQGQQDQERIITLTPIAI